MTPSKATAYVQMLSSEPTVVVLRPGMDGTVVRDRDGTRLVVGRGVLEMEDAQVSAILAHEVGHLRLHHL